MTPLLPAKSRVATPALPLVLREQDRDLIADVLFGGRNQDIDVAPLSAEIEYDDIALNGTVAENGYVKVVPAEFTAQNIDTFTVLNIRSGVATSLSSRDETITFDSTVYDGALVNVIVPISTISLRRPMVSWKSTATCSSWTATTSAPSWASMWLLPKLLPCLTVWTNFFFWETKHSEDRRHHGDCGMSMRLLMPTIRSRLKLALCTPLTPI